MAFLGGLRPPRAARERIVCVSASIVVHLSLFVFDVGIAFLELGIDLFGFWHSPHDPLKKTLIFFVLRRAPQLAADADALNIF